METQIEAELELEESFERARERIDAEEQRQLEQWEGCE